LQGNIFDYFFCDGEGDFLGGEGGGSGPHSTGIYGDLVRR